MNLSAPFVQRPVLTLLLSLAAATFGFVAYTQLPVNDLPDVEYPVMQVSARYPGANPMVMAQNVASPLERELLKIRGVRSVSSSNRQGNTSITVEFALGRPIDLVAPDVQAAINAATRSLPADLPSPPTYQKTNPNQQPILYIGLVSTTLTEGDLYDIAFNQVAQEITTIDGVSAVDVYGSARAVRVRVNPAQLYQLGLTYADLDAAIRRETGLISAGSLEGQALSLTLVPDTQLERAEDYAGIILAYREGRPVFLRDVADVVESVDNEDRRLNYSSVQIPPGAVGVVLAVQKAIGANAVEVASAIDALLPVLDERIPDSIVMRVIYSRAKSIIASLDDVKVTLVLAFVLVVLIIFLFLGRVTDTLVPMVVMPMSLLLTFIAMQILGFTIDNLSLMALTLSIGFLVDDAIVFLENTVRRMQDLHETPYEAALNGAKEISFTIVATSVTLIAVFLPVVFMPGLLGRIFFEFGMVIIVVVIASTVLALTLTPMMCARFLKAHDPQKRTLVEKGAHALEELLLTVYRPLLRANLRFWWVSLLVWVGIVGLGAWAFTRLPLTFLPTGDSSFISGIFLTRTGSSPDRVGDWQGQIDQAILANPNVDQFVTVSGVGEFLQSNFIIAFVTLKPPGERVGGLSIEAVNGELLGATASIPGVIPALRPQPTLEISTTGAGRQQGEYAFTISGIDRDAVYAAAQQLQGAMFSQMGTLFANVQSDLFLDNPEVNIAIDREAAARYSVGTMELGRMLQEAYSLNFSYLIKSNNQQYQVIVEAAREFRQDAADLDLLFLQSGSEAPSDRLSGSRMVPFSAVASATATTGPISINQLNNFSAVTISFDLIPGVPVGQATGFIENSAREIVPANLKQEFRGQAESFLEAVEAGKYLGIVAFFAMFIALGILYESYTQPITVMSALPVALCGGLLTLLAFGESLSLYAGIGLFMLIGIVQKNGILLVDFALMRQEEGRDRVEAVYEASLERFRPILMTTLSTVFGVLPIALGFGADGEARRSLGLVIVGGLVVAQVVTLFLTPSFFLVSDWIQSNIVDRVPLLQRGQRAK